MRSNLTTVSIVILLIVLNSCKERKTDGHIREDFSYLKPAFEALDLRKAEIRTGARHALPLFGILYEDAAQIPGFGRKMADAIVQDVLSIVQCDEKWISVVVEEIDSTEWPEKVYKPEILDKQDTLYKKPGYNPFE